MAQVKAYHTILLCMLPSAGGGGGGGLTSGGSSGGFSGSISKCISYNIIVCVSFQHQK